MDRDCSTPLLSWTALGPLDSLWMRILCTRFPHWGGSRPSLRTLARLVGHRRFQGPERRLVVPAGTKRLAGIADEMGFDAFAGSRTRCADREGRMGSLIRPRAIHGH